MHVYVNDNESLDYALRRFKRLVKDEKLFIQLKERSYHRTKSQKKRDSIRRNKMRQVKEYTQLKGNNNISSNDDNNNTLMDNDF